MVQALGEQVAELDTPSADGLAGDSNPAFQQDPLNVPTTHREAVVQPDGVSNELKRESVAGKLLTVEHPVPLLQHIAVTAHGQVESIALAMRP